MLLSELFNTITKEIVSGKELEECKDLVKECSPLLEDWEQFKCFCKDGYKRNLVFINDHIEMLILCWDRGQISGIHDHPDSGCVMAVLEGELKEDSYLKMDSQIVHNFSVIGKPGDVFYKKGSTGLHNILNTPDKCSVSLHIYSPPNYNPKFYKS